MTHRLDFDATTLTSVTGGKSVIDLPRLNLQTEAQAMAFIQAYGFRLDHEKDVNQLWYFYRRALVLIEERLGYSLESMPEVLRDRKNFDNPCQLLLWASSQNPADQALQRWSCVILRAMHVFVHAENDLFSSYSEEIQKQVLTPFQERIFTEGRTGVVSLRALEGEKSGEDQVSLAGFEIKPFKTSASTVIKLLAKSDALAMNVFDRLGVRFVTRSVLDTFRVIRFLVEHNLVSFPHIIPDQSSNTIYPADLFCETCINLLAKRSDWTDLDLEAEFQFQLEERRESIQWLRKENSFSGSDYRFIKFIARKLIRVQLGGSKEELSFFFPYEVQILDQRMTEDLQSGPSDHQQYKERQRQAARRRLFADLVGEGEKA